MRNLLFQISYDGTNYHGYQCQDGQITIQSELERVLGVLTGESLRITGCGRTDAGVHAIHYYFNVHTKSPIPCDRFVLAMNSLLPEDITVSDCREVAEDFHARFSPKYKTYVYRILNQHNPEALQAKRSYFYPILLDVKKMQDACSEIIGEKDFRCFMASGGQVKTTVRNVTELTVTKEGNFIEIRISANGFLYNMVRIITGTLIQIGNGKMTKEELHDIIERKERTEAGMTVPPHGLYLYDVYY
ncbi:MAG: tRNA pseudouridine(38-40) synthase TruA [Clostridia bacterium]|nr:tRNA pseudouridine(38-40) synthase TruA [Clostridia bacterium]